MPTHMVSLAAKPIRNALVRLDDRYQRVGPVSSGRFRIANEGQSYEIDIFDTDRTPVLQVYFSKTLLNSIVDRDHQAPEGFEFLDPHFDKGDRVMSMLAREIVDGMSLGTERGGYAAQESAMLFLMRAIRMHSNLSPPGHAMSRVALREVTEFINDNLSQPISLDMLANVAGVSNFTVIRSFQREFKKTPMRFIRDLRIQRAQSLLLNTSIPVTEVASRLGFKKVSHFITSFHKISGQTPLAFRRGVR